MSEIFFVRTKAELKKIIAQCDPAEDTLISLVGHQSLMAHLELVIHLIMDFDGTLTSENQWDNIRQLLNPFDEAQEERDLTWWLKNFTSKDSTADSIDDNDWFLDHSLAANNTAIEAAWIARHVTRFVSSGLRKEQFVNIGSKLKVRPGVAELFRQMEECVVVSMGTEQVIQACLEKHGLHAAVVATRLLFKTDGIIRGSHRNIVVSSTKKIAVRKFMELTGAEPGSIIAIGDSIVDIDMMPQNAMNVLIIPTDEKKEKLTNFRLQHIDTMWGKLKLVLVGKSFTPIADLINQARSA
jgi:HAD superfamily phosphoserine phosphatase-like hydrolase